MPGYYIANKLRGWYIGLFLKKKGTNFLLNREIIIERPSNIEIGNNVKINARCWISGGGGLTIEDDVLIGPNVVIHSSNHRFEKTDLKIEEQGHINKPVIIKKKSWIGASVLILPGVCINEYSIIGAGSVVTKDTEAYCVYVGNPAKKIKELKKN